MFKWAGGTDSKGVSSPPILSEKQVAALVAFRKVTDHSRDRSVHASFIQRLKITLEYVMHAITFVTGYPDFLGQCAFNATFLRTHSCHLDTSPWHSPWQRQVMDKPKKMSATRTDLRQHTGELYDTLHRVAEEKKAVGVGARAGRVMVPIRVPNGIRY